MESQGGIRVNLAPKMRQSFLNVTPRSQMMPNFTFPLHKYDSKKSLNWQQASAFTTCADTCEGKRSHATTPRIFKLHAEDLRRGVHRFHPGWKAKGKGEKAVTRNERKKAVTRNERKRDNVTLKTLLLHKDRLV